MYIENYSIFLDIKLILMTIQIMLKKESTEGFDKADEINFKRKELLFSGKDRNHKWDKIERKESETLG